MMDAAATLQERARILARPVVDDANARSDEFEGLAVEIDSETFMLPLDDIVAISPFTHIAPIPRATRPEFGVTVWRGRPITVFALHAAAPVISATSRLIVLGDARRAQMALLVDSVDDTETINRASLLTTTEKKAGLSVVGLTTNARMVLDIHSLLDSVSV